MMAAGQWALMSYLAHEGGAAVLGAYTLSLSFLTPAIAIINSGQRPLLAADYAKRLELGQVLLVRGSLVSAGMIVLLAALVVIGLLKSGETQSRLLILTIMLVSLLKSIESLSDAFYGVMQRSSEIVLQSRSILMRVVGGFIFGAVGDWITDSYVVTLICIASCWGGVLLLHDRRVVEPIHFRRVLTSPVAWRGGASAWRRGSAIGLATAVGAVGFNAPSYAISILLGLNALGFYTAMFSFVAVLSLVAASIGQAAISRIAGYMAARSPASIIRTIISEGTFLAVLALSAVGMSIIFGDWVLSAAFDIKSGSQSVLFPWFLASSIPLVLSQYLSFVVVGLGDRAAQLRASIWAALSGCVAGLFLTPHLGLVGSIVSVLIIGSVQLSAYGAAIWKALHKPQLSA
jgi:O-antigen/teichoic acid export membrane protein